MPTPPLSHAGPTPNRQLSTANRRCQARDLMEKLLDRDQPNRLGTHGGAEAIKAHPFFRSVDWALLRHKPAPLVPQPPAAGGN